MVVRKFLDLSTAHLRPETVDLIDGEHSPVLRFPHPDEYGWFIYVDEDWAVEDCSQSAPQDLVECLRYAAKAGCPYILFDCDAEIDEALPTYQHL